MKSECTDCICNCCYIKVHCPAAQRSSGTMPHAWHSRSGTPDPLALSLPNSPCMLIDAMRSERRRPCFITSAVRLCLPINTWATTPEPKEQPLRAQTHAPSRDTDAQARASRCSYPDHAHQMLSLSGSSQLHSPWIHRWPSLQPCWGPHWRCPCCCHCCPSAKPGGCTCPLDTHSLHSSRTRQSGHCTAALIIPLHTLQIMADSKHSTPRREACPQELNTCSAR